MKSLYFRTLLVVSGVSFFASCQSSSKEPKVAQVGDVAITVSEFKSRLQDTPPAYQQYATTPEGRRQFLNLLVREKVLLNEARRAGLQKDENFRQQLARFKKKTAEDVKDYEQNLLVQMELARLRAKEIAVSDADVQRYYDEHRRDFTHPIEVQASHILVTTSDDAERALARIKNGESFETVAKSVSMDPETAARGGKLIPFTKGGFLPEFENVVFGLKDGQVSGVVKSPFGFHVLKKNSQKSLPARSFDQVKDEIQKRLQRDKFDQWVAQAQTALGVKIEEQALASVAANPRESIQ